MRARGAGGVYPRRFAPLNGCEVEHLDRYRYRRTLSGKRKVWKPKGQRAYMRAVVKVNRGRMA